MKRLSYIEDARCLKANYMPVVTQRNSRRHVKCITVGSDRTAQVGSQSGQSYELLASDLVERGFYEVRHSLWQY